MSRALPVLVAAALAAMSAHALADTLLHLSETATVMAHPDELDATLRVEALSSSAAVAQRQVNAAMEEAVATAKKVAGLTVGVAGYFVWHVGPTPQDHAERWQASQSLTLTSHDGTALLQLVGELQQKGLAVSQLGWRLSDATEHQARADATRKAITALRGRAEEAAAVLGLRFGSFKEVRLDGARPMPMLQRAMTMGAAAAAAAPPPTAEATDVAVSATADADVVLLPK